MSQSQREFPNDRKISHNAHARRHSRKFTADRPADSLIAKAREEYRNGHLKPALALFEEWMRMGEGFDPEVYYLCGVISLALDNCTQAEMHLKILDKKVGNYKSNTQLLIAICLHKTNRDAEAIAMLSSSCSAQDADALFYRGKIQLRAGQYEAAAKDFQLLLGINKATSLTSILYFQSLLALGESEKALEGLTKVFLTSQPALKGEDLKRAQLLHVKLLIREGKVSEATKVLGERLSEKRDSEALYLKAELHRLRQEEDERILALNECITVKDNRKAVTQALEQLIIGSLKQKDFYEAFEYSKRSSFMKISSKSTDTLYKLSEGLTFLMKKKFGQALLMIGSIDAACFRDSPEHGYLNNLCNSALGYAYFSLGEHSEALKMYRKIQLDEKDESHQAFFYNIKLCEGIEAYRLKKYDEAIRIFQSATDHLIRPEPYLYISVILIQRGLASHASTELFMEVLEIIESGLKVGENCQMYYYRSLIYFYLGMNPEALEDVDRAIEKSEDNVARYFYLRALIFFQQRNYEQGISECSTCISIDENFYEAYLDRAKMKLICDEVEEAYQDLNYHPDKQAWTTLFELYQKNFHILVDDEMADPTIKETAYFHLGQFEKAGPAGKIILAIICSNFEVMALLDEAIQIGFAVGCLEIDDIYLLKSFCCFQLGNLEEASSLLGKAEDILRKNESGGSEGEGQERKLLAIKINEILISLKKDQLQESAELCERLIGDVYEGSIYDQLVKLRQFIREVRQQGNALIDISIFENQDLISDYLPDIELFGGKFRFIIPMPKVRVLEIEVVPYEQPLLEFTVEGIQSKAEAPWMRKGEHGVIFTNTVKHFEKLNLCTEENEDIVSSRERLKEELKLDNEVLSRLEKLGEKSKR